MWLDANEEVAANITLNNPNIRGGFSSEVVRLLKLSESQMGSVFNDIRLNDLFRTLKNEKPPKEKKPDKVPADGTGEVDGGPLPTTSESAQPDAVIVCPSCQSRWKMKDNSIVLNNTGKGDS